MTITEVAEIVHETQRVLGDAALTAWATAETWEKEAAAAVVTYVLTRLKLGHAVEPKECHNAWYAYMVAATWHYNATYSLSDKHHPRIKAWADLTDALKFISYTDVRLISELAHLASVDLDPSSEFILGHQFGAAAIITASA